MMRIHLHGERRRTIALASIMTLFLYLITISVAVLASSTPVGQTFGKFFALRDLVQTGIIAIVWLGWWIIAMAQRELIASNHGIYGAALAITQVRGLRTIGLTFGTLILMLLGLTYIFETIDTRLAVVGMLSAITLIVLGLPSAPPHTYRGEAVQVETIPTRQPALISSRTNSRQLNGQR